MVRRCVSLIALAHLLSLVMAIPMPEGPPTDHQTFKLFETHRAPATFTKKTIPTSHIHTLNLKIGLKSSGSGSIEKRLMQISDPRSTLYGRHLSLEDVKELSAPTPATLAAIKKWLSDHGFDESSITWSPSQDWATLNDVPLQKVEEMLDTSYSYYQHDDGETMIRTESYSLPHELHSHVELIQPTTMFGRLQRKSSQIHIGKSFYANPLAGLHLETVKTGRLRLANREARLRSTAPKSCTDPHNVTNRCLRELYKTNSYKLQTTGNVNKIGVTAFIGERANFADLKQFLHGEGLNPDSKFSVVSINGGTNPQINTPEEMAKHVGAEGNLDIQTTVGFTAPMTNIFYTTNGTAPFTADEFTPTNSNEPYLEWLQYLTSQPNSAIPQVISTSYGDDEQTVPASYATNVCRQLGILGARGVSLIFSSGDNGVGEEGTCVSNDGKKTPKFIPIFPASCPYVTSVGATQNFSPEEATSVDGPGGFPSGGGFSDYFQRPDYQSAQVSQYLSKLGSNYTGLYSAQGRGIPDVSAQGARYSMIWQKLRVNVGGSSAAAPTFASIIALLNDHRLANGLQPLGFLNPWLYSQGYKALNDIVTGSSSGCGTPGFAAAPGWDPVSGLGTPDFEAMKALMGAQPSQSASHQVSVTQSSTFFQSLNGKITNQISTSMSPNPMQNVQASKSWYPF